MADRIIGEGKFLRLLSRDGWELVTRHRTTGIVAIVAVTPERRIILTEQWRPPLQRRVVDLPAGLAGDVAGQEDEPLENAAKRELVEEVGYEAGHMARLAACPPSPGLTDEIVTFFRAEELRRVSAGGGDEHESIQVHEVPLDTLEGWCREREAEGVAIDLKLYAGLWLAGLTARS